MLKNLDINNYLKLTLALLWYFIGSTKTKFELEENLKIWVLLDIGVKMNIITKEIKEGASRPITNDPQSELVFYTTYN